MTKDIKDEIKSITWEDLVKIATEEYGFKEDKSEPYIYKFYHFIEIQIHKNGYIIFSVDEFPEDVIFSENRTALQMLTIIQNMFDEVEG